MEEEYEHVLRQTVIDLYAYRDFYQEAFLAFQDRKIDSSSFLIMANSLEVTIDRIVKALD